MTTLRIFGMLALPLALLANDQGPSEQAAVWQMAPWADTNVETVADPGDARPGHFRVTAKEKYGRLYIQAPANFKTKERGAGQKLRLSIMVPVGSYAKPYVGLYRTDGTAYRNLPAASYVPGDKLVPGTWHDISIPVSDFDAEDKYVGAIAVESEDAGTFNVHEFGFSTMPEHHPPSQTTTVTVTCEAPGAPCKATATGNAKVNIRYVTAKELPFKLTDPGATVSDFKGTATVTAGSMGAAKSKALTIVVDPTTGKYAVKD